jgi:PAP2 superfamily
MRLTQLLDFKQILSCVLGTLGIWFTPFSRDKTDNAASGKEAEAMTAVRRFIGIFVCVSLCAAVPARADVVTDWSLITINTVLAGPPVAGPGRLIEFSMVHIAMHDAVQAIQKRFETYSPGITPTTGSVIAAAAKAARDVLVNRFSAQQATLDAAYSAYLTAHQIAANDPGLAAGAQAAAAIIQGRAGDGAYPVPAPIFMGGTGPGQWRPTVFDAAGAPAPMAVAWMATAKPFTVLHSSQFFVGGPPRLTSSRYTRDYNEVKALGRNVGSTRTPEQTAIATFHSGNTVVLWNQTLRALAEQYVNNVGDSARLFALVNMAMADAAMSAWQSKIQYNVWRPDTAIQLGETDGNRHTVGDPTWRPLFANPNYPDYTSGANVLAGSATETLRLFFRTDRVNFSMVGPTSSRFFTRFSDASKEVVEARMYMGIHFRFADEVARSQGIRVGRWAYTHALKSLTDDEFDFIRTLDSLEPIEDLEGIGDGQDDDDAE